MTTRDEIWVQGEAFPEGRCFGCGPGNEDGLGLRSRPHDGGVRATWTPEPHHVGGGGFLCGGIIGTILDCHTGAAVTWWVRENHGAWPTDQLAAGPEAAPMYLTAGYEIRLLRPTPIAPVELYAEVAAHDEPEVTVHGHLESEGKRRAEIVARWRRFHPR